MEAYSSFSREQLRELVASGLVPFQRDLTDGTTTAATEFLSRVGTVRAQHGAMLRDMLNMVEISGVVTVDRMREVLADDLAALSWFQERMHAITFAGAAA